MNRGQEMLSEFAVQLLLTLLLVSLALGVAAGLLALALEALQRGASRWVAHERARRSFYVGRLEDARAAVYLVDRELVRLLFEETPAPESWAQISDGFARRLAADATGADESPRRGVHRVARRLAKAPPDGFVIERRLIAALAARSPARRWAHRLRAALPGVRLRRALARRLRAWQIVVRSTPDAPPGRHAAAAGRRRSGRGREDRTETAVSRWCGGSPLPWKRVIPCLHI